MLLGTVNEPLEVIGLETFAGQRDVERTYKRRTRGSVLGIDGCLKCPTRLKDMCIIGVPGAHSLLTYNPLTKFDADDPSWLKVSVRIPIGSVPVVPVVREEVVAAGGAWLTDPAAADAAAVDVEGRELMSVEVVPVADGWVACVVDGCVAPGTGDAVGVDVCDASILPIGFSDHSFELKG